NGDRALKLMGQYALAPERADDAPRAFRFGEGLTGQAALQDEITVVKNLPPGHLRVRSGTGESAPITCVLVPLAHAGRVRGVLELALLSPLPDRARELLLAVRQAVGIAIEVALARTATRDLLAETQRQAQRLSAQEEELRSNNEELEAQQEELRQANEELTQ